MKAWPGPGVFPMLAHQGGWDEMLLVVGPLVLIGLALYAANKRVAAQLASSQAAPGAASQRDRAQPPDRADDVDRSRPETRPADQGDQPHRSGAGAEPIVPGQSGDGPTGPAGPSGR